MAKTRHIKTRMAQRLIDQNLIDLTLSFGATQVQGKIEKYFLTKKNIDITLERLDRLRCRLIRAKDKGGIALITNSNGLEITTYRIPKLIKKFRKDKKYHDPTYIN